MPRRARLAIPALLALLALFASPAAADRGGFVIHSFDTKIVVRPDASLDVTERLVAEFFEPRHGLYRTIPVRYSDPRGFAYTLGVRGVWATGDLGAACPVKVTDEGRYVKIRIGDPAREVQGLVVYMIGYTVRDALGHFPEHDEVYWNATGNEWNATIESATATVFLPAPLDSGQLETAGYTGSFGSRERAVTITHPERGVVRFEGSRSLEPLEGLTVAVGWPHGHVRFPSPWARAGAFAADNVFLLAPLAWFAYAVRRYRRSGRDAEPTGPVMVQYEPPPGISPGGVGTLIDESVDLSDITATIVDLAIRGHLTLRVEPRPQFLGLAKRDETVFHRAQPPAGARLAPHEEKVLAGLFASGDVVDAGDLAEHFYEYLPAIRAALYDQLVELGYFGASPQKVRNAFIVQGLFAGLLTGGLGWAWMAFRGIADPARVLVPVVAGVLTWALFAAFSPAMPRRTAAGARLRRWALGFQEYARRVEADRLQRDAADPRATFEALLPHAMALGVAATWARKFEGIYAQSGPTWYAGPSQGGGFSTRSFEQSLSSAMVRTRQTMTAAPRSSSGSGGGGSSGGGGGGGGGGSW